MKPSEVHDLDSGVELAVSTDEFFRRFEFIPSAEDGEQSFREECSEFLQALSILHSHDRLVASGMTSFLERRELISDVFDELADVVVTMVGLSIRPLEVGGQRENLPELLIHGFKRVSTKNNKKTEITHVVHNGKIRRRSSI